MTDYTEDDKLFDDDSIFEDNDLIVSQTPTMFDNKRDLNNARSRTRSAIARELGKAEENQRRLAETLMHSAAEVHRQMNDPAHRKRMIGNAVAYSITQLSSAVLNSMDVDVPVSVRPDTYSKIVHGSTNFNEIELHVNTSLYDPDNKLAVASLIKCVKGVLYHEGGHVKFSMPFKQLMRNSSYASNHPVYEAKVITAAELASKLGDSTKLGDRMPLNDLIRAWNILEDQRAETAMCIESPVMARYFTEVVLNIVVGTHNPGDAWPWLVGRTYLPKEYRQLARNLAEVNKNSHLINDINRCVMTYRTSRDYEEMMSCVVDLAHLLIVWVGAADKVDVHHPIYLEDERKDKTPSPDSIPQVGEYKVENYKPSAKPDGADGARSGDPKRGKGERDQDQSTPGKFSGMSSGGDPTYENDEKVKAMSPEEEAEVNNFIRTTTELSRKPMLPDSTLRAMPDHHVKRSMAVANSMMNVLQDLVTDADPSWVFRQEDGVLDPTAYMLREPGDTDYWSGLSGDYSPGNDLAVSILVDTSGSMSGVIEEVSIATMGIKKACYDLGIPCTVTSFNDDARMVSEADEEFKFVSVGSTGGTYPITALINLDNQKCGKTYHLVVILTDGEWHGIPSVSPWMGPKRHIILVGFGLGMLRLISNKGANSYKVIEDPLELPKITTEALVGYLV